MDGAVDGSVKSSGRHRWMALLTAFAIYTMLGIDRGAIAIVIEPLKREFGLSDSKIAFLTGFAFSTFFAMASIPLGYLVDRRSRKQILLWSLFTFSAFTALTGWSPSYLFLVIARFGVGAGEAGGTPAATSLLSDYFPERRRATALSLYYLGSPVAAILVLVFGSYLSQTYGWRTVFWTAGSLGLVVWALGWFTIKEPARGLAANRDGQLSLGAIMRFAVRQPSLCHLMTTTALTSAVSAGSLTWAVSFLVRTHGMALAEAGPALAMTYGVAGAVGTLLSGPVVDRLGRFDMRWRCWFLAFTQLLGLPGFLLFVLSDSTPLALAGFSLWGLAQAALLSPVVSICHSLVRPRMRGTVTAVYTLLAYFVGFTVGPHDQIEDEIFLRRKVKNGDLNTYKGSLVK